MENDPAVLDPLLETESWQTLATFARESARTVILYIFYIARAHLFFLYYSTTTSTTRARRTVESCHG